MDRPTPYPQTTNRMPADLLEEAIRSARAPRAEAKGFRRRVAAAVMPCVTSLTFQLSLAVVGYATIRCLAPSLFATHGTSREPIAMPIARDEDEPVSAREGPRTPPDAGLIQLAGAGPNEGSGK
jgi:hypothetical protein